MLWGYPELLDAFCEEIFPTLAPIRLLNIEKARAPGTSVNNQLWAPTESQHLVQPAVSEAVQREVRLIEYYPLAQGSVHRSGRDGSPSPLPSVRSDEDQDDFRTSDGSADVMDGTYARDERSGPGVDQIIGTRGDDSPFHSPSGSYSRKYGDEGQSRWQEIFHPQPERTTIDDPDNARVQELRHAQSVEALYFGDEVIQNHKPERAESPFSLSESEYAVYRDDNRYSASDSRSLSGRRNDTAGDYFGPSDLERGRPLSTILDGDEDDRFQASSLASVIERNIDLGEVTLLGTEVISRTPEEHFTT